MTRYHKKSAAFAVLLSSAVVSPLFATATFTYDLRFDPTTPGLTDPHNLAIVNTGGTYTLQLWGQINGDTTYTNDGFVHGFVGIGSAQSLGGGFSSGGIVSGVVDTTIFSAPASINGGSGTITADGISDWGSADTSNPNNWLLWQATTGQPPGVLAGSAVAGLSQSVNANTWEVLLATYTVSPTGTVTPGGTTNFNVLSGLSGTVVTSQSGTLTTAPAIINCIDTANTNSAQTLTAVTTIGVNFVVPTILNVFNGNTITLGNADAFSATNVFAGGVLILSNGGLLTGGTVTNNGNLTFTNINAASHTSPLTGTGTLTQSGAGTTTLTGIANYSGPTTISNGTLIFGGGVTHTAGAISGATGALQVAATTTLNSNAVNVNAWTVNGKHVLVIGSGASKVNSLTIGAAGQLDITKNKLIVEGTSSAAATLIAASLNTYLATAYVNTGTGLWTGKGLTSSTVANDTKNQSMAMAIGADLSPAVRTNLGIDSTAVIVTRAVLGDADLNGNVGLSDLAAVYNNFGANNGKWTSGAFERNAATGQPLAVGLADLADVYNHFGQNTPAQIGILPIPGGTSAVPEPTSLAFLGLSSLLLLRRTKHRV